MIGEIKYENIIMPIKITRISISQYFPIVPLKGILKGPAARICGQNKRAPTDKCELRQFLGSSHARSRDVTSDVKFFN